MTDLARQVGYVARDLEVRGYAYAGVVRQAARALLGLIDTAEGCAGCGAELMQPGRGRRRKWCSERCRRRHRP